MAEKNQIFTAKPGGLNHRIQSIQIISEIIAMNSQPRAPQMSRKPLPRPVDNQDIMPRLMKPQDMLTVFFAKFGKAGQNHNGSGV